MRSARSNSYKSLIASSALVLAMVAGASPLPREAASATGDGRAERRLSEADLASSYPGFDLPQFASGNISAQFLGTHGNRRADSTDSQAFDPGRPGSGDSIQDMLRGFVTVRRAGMEPSAAQSPTNIRRPPEDSLGIDLGLSTNEWVRESLQGVFGSVLSLAVDERGNASFSVLDLGDFSIVISADRSEVAFTSGDDVLVSARRVGAGSGGDGGYPAGYSDAEHGRGSAPATPPGESPLRQAIALVLDIASHPLSFIVYVLIAGYALASYLFSVHGRRTKTAGKSRRSSRHHSVSSVLDAAAMMAAPVVKKPRKRIRVRVRARKYR